MRSLCPVLSEASVTGQQSASVYLVPTMRQEMRPQQVLWDSTTLIGWKWMKAVCFHSQQWTPVTLCRWAVLRLLELPLPSTQRARGDWETTSPETALNRCKSINTQSPATLGTTLRGDFDWFHNSLTGLRSGWTSFLSCLSLSYVCLLFLGLLPNNLLSDKSLLRICSWGTPAFKAEKKKGGSDCSWSSHYYKQWCNVS